MNSSAAEAISGEVLLEETADYRCDYPSPPGFSDIVKGYGSIPLVIPKSDGPVQGKGSFTHHGSGYSFAGPLVLNGSVRQGRLHFPFPKGYSGGQQVYNRDDPISIPLRNEAVTVFDMASRDHGVTCSGSITFRLSKAIERWQITIHDERENMALAGSKKGNHAGLSVRVKRDIRVTIEKGKFKNGAGEASFVSIKPYSHPPGVYACKPASMNIVGTGSDIDFERLDQTKWAKRFNPPKTPADKVLKTQWEKLKKHKTPVIYPQTFAVKGIVSGRSLDLQLPKNSGYTVGIYCRLSLPKTDPRASSMRREHIGIEPSDLPRRLQVQLKDGWHHEETWSFHHPGARTVHGKTEVDVRAAN